ncbi:MAG: glycosyltransferase [Magnetococcales bacterium]|nr:glycosyltransferase [Magnetococcales bacterium]
MKLLCLSFWTPPQPRPQAILIGKMIPEWRRQGLEPVILTYENQGEWAIDAPLTTIPVFQRDRLGKLSRIWGNWQERRHQERMRRIAAQAIRAHGLPLIFSFANPMESNFLGIALKRELGLPCVSHFSDPYADSPLKEISPRQHGILLAREREVVAQSDRVVFVNDSLRRLVMQKYPDAWQAKAVVIPHCYDPALHRTTPPANERFILSHVGVFYPARHPEKLFQAMAALRERRPGFEHAFLLRLVGGVNPYAGFSRERLGALIGQYGLQRMVEILPTVDYQASLDHMADSDALLAIDVDLPASPFLPSKLIDYLGARRPILALTPSDSPTWEVVTRAGGIALPHHATDGIATALEELVARRARQPLDDAYARQFGVASTTARYRELFADLLAERGVA